MKAVERFRKVLHNEYARSGRRPSVAIVGEHYLIELSHASGLLVGDLLLEFDGVQLYETSVDPYHLSVGARRI